MKKSLKNIFENASKISEQVLGGACEQVHILASCHCFQMARTEQSEFH